MKFGTRLRLKPSNDRGEFELDRARSKNNIAENLFALGHETNNSAFFLQLKKPKCIWAHLEPISFSPIVHATVASKRSVHILYLCFRFILIV